MRTSLNCWHPRTLRNTQIYHIFFCGKAKWKNYNMYVYIYIYIYIYDYSVCVFCKQWNCPKVKTDVLNIIFFSKANHPREINSMKIKEHLLKNGKDVQLERLAA